MCVDTIRIRPFSSNAYVVRCVMPITRQCDARHSEVSSTKCSQSKGKKRLRPSDRGCQEPHQRTRAFYICFQGTQKGRRPVARRFSNRELEHYRLPGPRFASEIERSIRHSERLCHCIVECLYRRRRLSTYEPAHRCAG